MKHLETEEILIITGKFHTENSQLRFERAAGLQHRSNKTNDSMTVLLSVSITNGQFFNMPA